MRSLHFIDADFLRGTDFRVPLTAKQLRHYELIFKLNDHSAGRRARPRRWRRRRPTTAAVSASPAGGGGGGGGGAAAGCALPSCRRTWRASATACRRTSSTR